MLNRIFKRLKRRSFSNEIEDCFYPSGWSRSDRGRFNRLAKADFFKGVISFHSTNELEGDYFEFGCYGGFTMRMAWDYHKMIYPEQKYFAFDSFEGFPKIEGIDKGYWKEGDLCMSEAHFRRVCESHGMPKDRLVCVKGYFENSLGSGEVSDIFSNHKARVIYIDVDVYTPASEILRHVAPIIQRGTIVAFDDWNCFFADNNLGERKAWAEFCKRHPEAVFEPFFTSHQVKAFACVKEPHV